MTIGSSIAPRPRVWVQFDCLLSWKSNIPTTIQYGPYRMIRRSMTIGSRIVLYPRGDRCRPRGGVRTGRRGGRVVLRAPTDLVPIEFSQELKAGKKKKKYLHLRI